MDTNSSLLQSEESDNYRYISHVDFIRMLRDSYKEGTENTFNNIRAQVENEGKEKIHQAEKVQTLLGHCRHSLQQLNDQRKSIGRTLEQHIKQTKLLSEQIHKEKSQRMQTLQQNEAAICQLLNDLKSRET